MLRTIEAPGIEIREVDKSTYARSLTGTNVLVAGFANKGKDYIPMVMTSKNAWLNYYGQPTNEAERYFYRASMEVINQGGKLYASKLPYDNDAKDIYVCKKYTVNAAADISSSVYAALISVDTTIDKYSAIDSTSNTVISIALSTIEEYETGEESPGPGEIIIIDALRSKYDAASFKDLTLNTAKEYLGIIPVITTAANAMFYQSLLDLSGDLSSTTSAYYTLSSIESLSGEHTSFSMLSDEVAIPFYSSDRYTETVSNKVNRLFPAVQYVSSDKIDRDNLLKIGLVVLKAYVDPSAGNKINFDVLESYVGELDRNAKDPSTGATTFIQEIINSQSQYIEIFIGDMTSKLSAADILTIKEQKAGSLGFYSDMVKKEISYTESISEGLLRVYEKNSDINEKDIDLVVDAGVSNIAQYICSMYDNAKKGIYAPEYSKSSSTPTTGTKWTVASKDDSNTWRDIITSRYNEFCKNTRRDCMFIADGLRPFCIEGSKKIVRPSKPSVTIESAIIPKLKYMSGINTSYGAGYCDWFEVMDEFSGKLFWCPPSIQACGVYINTDLNANYWDAPAGLNRGMITALDTAFSPSIKQAGEIYQKCWNYAINYPDAGITLEGQKTFQVKPSAFDRVNVRRMFLRLERYVYKIARYYVYEGNTAYNRQRFVDQIVPYFETVKRSGGMYDYKIICDETINTPDVIDNNELRIKIGIKPTKTIEFILLQFVCLRTGGSFEEM